MTQFPVLPHIAYDQDGTKEITEGIDFIFLEDRELISFEIHYQDLGLIEVGKKSRSPTYFYEIFNQYKNQVEWIKKRDDRV